MIKPLIGITPQYDYDNNFIRIQAHYLEAISTAGGIPFLLPLDTDPNDIDQDQFTIFKAFIDNCIKYKSV